jgi:hypothetical protein
MRAHATRGGGEDLAGGTGAAADTARLSPCCQAGAGARGVGVHMFAHAARRVPHAWRVWQRIVLLVIRRSGRGSRLAVAADMRVLRARARSQRGMSSCGQTRQGFASSHRG